MGLLFKDAAAVLAVLAVSTPPASAGDCAPVVAASLATAGKPYSTTVTRTGKDGKQAVTHTVATMTATYVEVHGKWRSMSISSQDRIDTFNELMQSAKFSCEPAGTDSVNGQAANVYNLTMDNEGTVSKDKLWISADQLILRAHYQSEENPDPIDSVYDYSHVEPPADSTPVGK